MKSYRKKIIRRVVCIICIIAAGGFFADEVAAQTVLQTDNFDTDLGNWNCSASGCTRDHPGDSDYSLKICDNGTGTMSTTLDLSGYNKASLEFNWQHTGLNNDNDDLDIEISDDGSSWNALSPALDRTLGTSGTWLSASYSLSVYTGAGHTTVQIRFIDGGLDSGTECVYLDDIQIAAQNTTCAAATKPSVPTTALNKADLGSHTYPTYLFVASYDWLHNFYDRNARGARGDYHQSDPDTDNFNKIIVLDSNLFPIMTAVAGDHEFPNITSRNTVTWWTGSPSLYSPSVNDYFNRGIAVAPDFIAKQSVQYSMFSAVCEGGNWVIRPTYQDLYQYGARSIMKWAFITDPGNNNIRRYEFEKPRGFFELFDAESDVGGTVVAYNGNEGMKNVCNGTGQVDEIENNWGYTDTKTVLGDGTGGNNCEELYTADVGPYGTCDPATATGGCYENEKVLWTCKHSAWQGSEQVDDISDLIEVINGTGSYTNTGHNAFPYLEFTLTIPETETFPYNLDLNLFGNARDNTSNNLVVGINTHTGTVTSGQFHGGGGTAGTMYEWNFLSSCDDRDNTHYTFPINTSDDQDSGEEGIQIVIRLYSMKQGGFVLDQMVVGEQDSAFAVKYDGSQSLREVRWNIITSFLETVPPESYPAYPSYTSSANRTIGFGHQTNTSFTTAKYVRFRDPRDIAVYRDMFDLQNNGPAYVFVADTGNSRIQVFMNATGSAGETNASFPIRPVPVKGPNVNDFRTNELAIRFPSGRYGHGYKADWRWYTTLPGTTFINISAGKGEFYSPHGVAVDQDPNTKDVYLFVADTFNHRIQVFRDLSGVSSQAITTKQFDFQFERGWGTYPLQTTMTMTPPGPYNFRYPKGLDIARFQNNSSYLYVVDSKNYRVLKYLITENGAGGINNISIVAGYGYDGTNFATNLTTLQGVPVTFHNTTAGFLNPQDLATGYSGFYLYSAPNAGGYPHQVSLNGQTVGIHYLNNNMFYVTDYARNDTSISTSRLNMRVMQFFDPPQSTITTLPFPWETTTVSFGKGELGQSVHGVFYGVHSSASRTSASLDIVEGATENIAGKDGLYSDRPVGIATLAWDTLNPFDIRVIDPTNNVLYPNGATIDNDTTLRVGVHARAFFGIPYRNLSTYTNFTSGDYGWDGKKTQRVHVFCYNTNGVFQNHTAWKPPFEFTPETDPPNCGAGYMKIIAEENLFEYSGKTGTMIFKMTD